MKKLMIASAIAMSIASGSVMASQGDIQFFGNVTAETCDLTPEINGAVSNMIQLGTVKVNADGTPVDFALKKAQGATCPAAAAKNATITWNGNLGINGVMNQGGLATDAHVVLTAKNAIAANTEITSAKQSAEFDKSKLDGEGYLFSAQLKGGATPGDFQSASAYAVTYQ